MGLIDANSYLTAMTNQKINSGDPVDDMVCHTLRSSFDRGSIGIVSVEPAANLQKYKEKDSEDDAEPFDEAA